MVVEEINLFAIYSEDDGVTLCDSQPEAEKLMRRWEKQGANGVEGPFGPFRVGVEEFIKDQDALAVARFLCTRKQERKKNGGKN